MAGGNNVARMSPRQRMINLMYIVLTAMLALNVSSDVLNGFSKVQDGMDRTNRNLSVRNNVQFEYLRTLYQKNPAKAGKWYAEGERLNAESSRLYNEIEQLKTEIAKAADGETGNYKDIKNNDDLEAASVTMLNPTTQKGKKLRGQVESYTKYVSGLIADTAKRGMVRDLLTPRGGRAKDSGMALTWEQTMFENMPAVAAVTLLSKLQNDIRVAESEAMSCLISSVDMGDVRVNELNAYVIPTSNMIMRGGKYSANIVLAAVDTTQRPEIFVNGAKLNNRNGLYEFVAGAVGTHEYTGYIQVLKADGSIDKRPFKSSYTVIEPMATISPTMMNLLYAGIPNPISISVPGVPMSAIQATISNGSLVRNGDKWVASVSRPGTEAEITVSATVEGRTQVVGSMKFRVRKLPDPSPYLAIRDGNGNVINYKGTPRRISKGVLMNLDGLSAGIDDDILDVNYNVVSFSTVFYDQMGNAIPELSNGPRFSERQKEQFRRLKPGKSFWINNVKAKGPDGITRDISPMEVGIN